MNINLLSSCWITHKGLGYGPCPEIGNREPVFPDFKELFPEPMTRFGRFDTYTKLGCAGIAAVIKSSGIPYKKDKQPVGLLISSEYESYKTDIDYYETTIEEKGMFTSPKKFSYTLPGIVIGECAAYFNFTGPTFCIGENREKGIGHNALLAGVNLLLSGNTDTIITGWLDYPPDITEIKQNNFNFRKGAIFVVLSTKNELVSKSKKTFSAGKLITLSLPDLFNTKLL